MAFEELDEVLDGRFALPIGEHTYFVPEPTALEGLRLQRLFADPNRVIDDATELREIRKLLGPVWDEMNANGVGYRKAIHAGRTVLLKYGLGDSFAETYWAGGLEGLGKASAPIPKQRRRLGRVFARMSAKAS